MEILVLVLAALLVAVGIALFVVDARRRSGGARPNPGKEAAQAPDKVPAAVLSTAVAAEVADPPEEPVANPVQISPEELLWSTENDRDPQAEVDREGDGAEFSVDSPAVDAGAPDEGDSPKDAGPAVPVPGFADPLAEPESEAPVAAPPQADGDGLFGAVGDSTTVEAPSEDPSEKIPDEATDRATDDVTEDVAERWDNADEHDDGNGRGGMPSEDLYAGLDDVPVSTPTPDTTADLTEESPVPPPVTADRPSVPKSRFGGFAGRIKPKVGGRRARRAWAMALQAEFEKSDHELSAELDQAWVRGPKGAAQDVVRNIFVDGRRFLLTDIGESTVLALQTPLSSDVVLEFARSTDFDSPDLSHVGIEDGFLVSSNQPEVIHRVFDDRAHYVLRMMAAKIERQWTEDGWVVAVLDHDSGPTDWDEALEPLSDFADIARRLPPAKSPVAAVDMSDWDPSRPSTTPAAVKNVENTSGRRPAIAEKYTKESERRPGGHLSAVPQRDDRVVFTGAIPIIDEEDPVWRPAPEMPASEPYDLPSRSVSSRFGDLEFRDLGTAEDGEEHSSLPALGEDPEHIRARRTAGRVVREDTGPSGIFSDGSPYDEWAVVHEDDASGDNDRDTN